ncbi:GNAT family N-acetyltransferase [Zavarzinia sp. CC-PAN008]|uniref:GNAT family N-acetyltransferase n=1 Tax=Zavarzinia sp. CC-PAN008 TaxID=3243332 RepID=UPI003F745419
MALAHALDRTLFDLLEASFPGLTARSREAERWGQGWLSQGFTQHEAGRVVAHVGLIPIDLVLDGAVRHAGYVHAVCTAPAYRRQGRCAALMHEVLAHCDGRFEMLVLFTEQPEIYDGFGFRVVAEQCFALDAPGSAGGLGLRRLRSVPQDAALLAWLLERRTPVSRVLGVGPEKTIFTFNECASPLFELTGLNAVVSLEVEGPVLRLYDVVALELPSLADILARIPRAIERVEFHFSPDRFTDRAVAVPARLEDVMMVRGPFLDTTRAFMLPRPAR